MRKIFIALFFLSMSSMLAQDLNNYMNLLKSDLSSQKVDIITFNMMFTEKESKTFWPIYKEYEQEMGKLGDARFKIIKDYADNYLSMTDEKAEQIMEQSFAYREARMKLKKELWKTLKDELSATKAAKFIQLENQIQQLIDVKISAELPLIEKTAID